MLPEHWRSHVATAPAHAPPELAASAPPAGGAAQPTPGARETARLRCAAVRGPGASLRRRILPGPRRADMSARAWADPVRRPDRLVEGNRRGGGKQVHAGQTR